MKRWVDLARFVGIGWYIATCIILGVGVGIWLDRQVDSWFAFTFLGLGLGLVLAFYGLYRMLQPFLNREKRGRREG